MSAQLTNDGAAALLYGEALALDERRWEEWLAFYTEDAIYWAPAWKSEGETTSDPNSELSLIYYQGRAGLEDRIWRLKSGLSVASNPLRRTAHMINNVQIVERANAGQARVKSTFAVHVYDPKRKSQHVYFGLYDYDLRQEGDAWKIAGKIVRLLNDNIPAVADIYML